MTTTRTGGWLQTYTGGQFFPLDPRAEEVRVQDIAHALANLCRFGGHCTHFYSVAQHSVIVSRLVPVRHALQALLHDAAEAYLVDVPRPLKLELPEYRVIEKRVQAVIYERFGLPAVEDPCIKQADDRALAQEHRDLMMRSAYDWSRLADERPLPMAIQALPAEVARGMFMTRFHSLTGGGLA